MRKLAAQFLALAEKQGAIAALMVGHRLMGMSLVQTGDISEGRAHFDQAIALYDPTQHRPLATRFGGDSGVSILSNRSWAQWILGYPAMALADAERALQDAREIAQAATLMYPMVHGALPLIYRGDYVAANKLLDEVVVLTDERSALYWKALGMMFQGCLFALIGRASDAAELLTSGITAFRSTGTIMWMPLYLSHLAEAHAELGQLEEACRCIGEATSMIETTNERWYEAEINRIAGVIALNSPEGDARKAEAYFKRALAVARQQQAKSWELRAAMSLARLWRDQGKVQQARELLAPVYGWFTEGFDTLDLKEAKELLEELAA